MKYMLMMSGTKADFDWYLSWPKEDLRANGAFMVQFARELVEAGAFVSAEGLAFPDQARIVRAGRKGLPVTDGVFPETKEFLAGFWIVEVESAEHAYRLAARAAMAPGPGGSQGLAIEVRQILSAPPE